MEAPADTSLPFFAYGLFKPGQLGFLRLRHYVVSCPMSTARGQLKERDGLPVLVPTSSGSVRGALLRFRSQAEAAAYDSIVALEPDKQYRWVEIEVLGSGHPERANVLIARNPEKGTVDLEENDWDGSKDPLFTTALNVVEETRDAASQFDWDLKPLFRLEMAYLLLWSAIERYASLRYHLGDDVVKKISAIADEPAFTYALGRHVSKGTSVQRADRPADRETLDPTRPKDSILYYYQLRNNLAHRGKAVSRDHTRLHSALLELVPIFREVLADAFEQARRAASTSAAT